MKNKWYKEVIKHFSEVSIKMFTVGANIYFDFPLSGLPDVQLVVQVPEYQQVLKTLYILP